MGATRTARLSIIAAALIATALLAGCGTQTPIASSGPDTTSPPQATWAPAEAAPGAIESESEATEPDTTETYAFGQSVPWENMISLTVTSARRARLAEYDSVTAGKRAIVVHVKVTNNALTPLDASATHLTVYTGDSGEPAEAGYLSNYNEIAATRLGTDKTASGDYVFEVPRAAMAVTVEVGPGYEYDPAVFTGRIA